MTTSSCLISAPSPRRPTTSSAYFAEADVRGAKSCSCAFGISGVVGGTVTLLVVASLLDPAICAVPVQRPADAFTQRDGRRVADFGARARDVEGAALGEKV